MSKKLKYEKALYCIVCNKLVGSRPMFDMELAPGTRIEIICTCKECGKDPLERLKDIFKI
jgi:RNase P subunit RPR2